MPMPVIIAIASAGRSGVIHQTLGQILSMSDQPDAVWVCLPEDGDEADQGEAFPHSVRVLTAPRGLCAQRNVVMDAAPADGVVLFLDDDFLLGDGSISALRRLFAEQPDVVMATGRVIADGIGGPGFDHTEGQRLLNAATAPESAGLEPVYNAYGCNMAIRVGPAQAHALRFDTDLPMYGWLEDLDLSRRMADHGRIVRTEGLYGVHLGTKKGRSPGVRLGYSQIANPIHLIRKGTITKRKALRLMTRNMLANSGRALWPEPWIDRLGRLRGNATALADLVRGRLAPRRILDL